MAFRQLSLGRLNWRRAARWLDWMTPLGFGLALVLLVPWRTVFRFGRCEGYELMKGLLVSQGHPLYGAFWNDQPPLHTELLTLLFRLFGPSAGVGRLLSMGLAMLLVSALYGLARRGSNRVAGLVAVALLASSSQFLELSVSAMLELPAFALGLAAVWAWTRWEEGSKRRWLAVSGALLGCALQVKLTAALLLPALAVDFMVWGWRHRRRAKGETNAARRVRGPGLQGAQDTESEFYDVGRVPSHGAGIKAAGGTERRVRGPGRQGGAWWGAVLIWLGSAVGVFGLITLRFYQPGTWAVFWASHFSAGTHAGATTGGTVFKLTALEADLAPVVAAVVGLGLLGWKRRRELLFPAVLLLTVAVVHWFHRPFWPYYRLHFWIPLAWLGGVGLVEGFRILWRSFPPSSKRGGVRFGIGWLAWSLAVATTLTLAPEKTWWELRRLRWAPLAKDEARVASLRAHGAGVQWVFTDNMIGAFWAGLPIPPELAVIPDKRLWSRQISPAFIRNCLERYRPELILLSESRVERFGLADYLKAHYRPAAGAPGLYLRKAP